MERGHLLIVVGVALAAQIKIRSVHQTGNRMRLPVEGLGLVRGDLPEHGIGDIGLDDAILSFQSLGQFHQ